MNFPRKIRGVVFDMDGLLVDTEVLFREAMRQAAIAMGGHMPDHVFVRMVGLNHAQAQHIVVEHFGEGFDFERYQKETRHRFDTAVEAGLEMKAGVVELLDVLDQIGLPRAIATSSPHREVDRNLGQLGLRHRFHAVMARGDYQHGKPHPEPFLKAAEALNLPPEACLALEDSYNGVRAAHAAGMMTVMVPDLLEATAEMQDLCVLIAESLHEVRDLIAASADPKEPM